MEIVNQIRHDIVAMLFHLSDVKSLLSIKSQLESVLADKSKWESQQRESLLLQKLNTECVLPEADWLRFVTLNTAKAKRLLTTAEQLELDTLIASEEQLRLQRILVLGELAKLKKIPLMELSKTLNIESFQ